MTTEAGNRFKYMLTSKVIDFPNDVFKVILMQTGFVFDKDTHDGYADVSAYELPTNFGYTAGGVTLSGVVLTEDVLEDRVEVTWNNATWTAAGGDIGPSPGAIIYDDTVTTLTADPVIGYIDFGGDQTQTDGGTATIINLSVYIS